MQTESKSLLLQRFQGFIRYDRFRLLNSIKTKFSKDVIYICKEKILVHHILFNCRLMKSFLPPDWSSKEHDPVPLVTYFKLCVCEISLFSDGGLGGEGMCGDGVCLVMGGVKVCMTAKLSVRMRDFLYQVL